MRRLLAPALLLFASACGTPAAAPAPPSLQVTSTSGDLGHWTKQWQFAVQGRSCESLTLKLLHITETGADVRAEYSYRRLGKSVQGSFGLIEQHGEPFDRPGQIYIDFDQNIPAGERTARSQEFPILQGPFPNISQQVLTDASPANGVETVVFARCLADSAPQRFVAGGIEDLVKHAAETKAVIIALTLRWDASGR